MEKNEYFLFFFSNYFFGVFLDRYDMLMSKIKKNILMHFQMKNTFKKNSLRLFGTNSPM
jgi:hypothetical protein